MAHIHLSKPNYAKLREQFEQETQVEYPADALEFSLEHGMYYPKAQPQPAWQRSLADKLNSMFYGWQIGSQGRITDGPEEQFLTEVRAELVRARTKFPGDRVTLIALGEEFGELCKAMLDESGQRVHQEAVQTAVMAARIALDGDSSVKELREERKLDPLGTQ